MLRVGGDRRAEEEVVDVVEQRTGVDAAAQVADARAALVEDPAERARSPGAGPGAPAALWTTCSSGAPWFGAPRQATWVRWARQAAPSPASAPATRATSPPMEWPTSAIRSTGTRPVRDDLLEQPRQLAAVLDDRQAGVVADVQRASSRDSRVEHRAVAARPSPVVQQRSVSNRPWTKTAMEPGGVLAGAASAGSMRLAVAPQAELHGERVVLERQLVPDQAVDDRLQLRAARACGRRLGVGPAGLRDRRAGAGADGDARADARRRPRSRCRRAARAAGSAAGPRLLNTRSAMAAWTHCAGVVASRSAASPAARPRAPISSWNGMRRSYRRLVLHRNASAGTAEVQRVRDALAALRAADRDADADVLDLGREDVLGVAG